MGKCQESQTFKRAETTKKEKEEKRNRARARAQPTIQEEKRYSKR